MKPDSGLTEVMFRGFFGKGEMQREFEEVAFNLRVGEMSDPVSTPSGIHLIERIA